jgi:hypothetical protein
MSSPSQIVADVAHPRLPAELTSEMTRLYSAGFSLIPLGGPDGKKPIVEFRGRKRLPLSIVVERMGAAGSHCYGIRLADMIVVDVDTDNSKVRSYVKDRFGSSPAQTRTSRGFHLFFRHDGPRPRQVRAPGIAIDFKAGANDFVVGPRSIRPDGVIYDPVGWLVAPGQLPHLLDRDEGPSRGATAIEPDRRIVEGQRHTALKEHAHRTAITAASLDELVAEMLHFRDTRIERPEEFGDDQVRDLAGWFWERREAGNLWGGRNSVVGIHRAAIHKLAGSGELLAFALHCVLLAEHGHLLDVRFAIVPDALRKSGRIKAGRRQIYAATDLLIEVGLLECVSKARGNRNCHLYRLARQATGEQGGGSNLILVSSEDTHSVACQEAAA